MKLKPTQKVEKKKEEPKVEKVQLKKIPDKPVSINYNRLSQYNNKCSLSSNCSRLPRTSPVP